MGPIVFFETSAEAAAKLERELIEEKMTEWVDSVDAVNAASRDFSKYYVCEYDDSEKVIEDKEKNINKLRRKEKRHRRDLSRQIVLCTTRDEYPQLDLKNPGQIIDWVVRQASSPIPRQASRWGWVLERRDVIFCNPGPYDRDIVLMAE
jgi:hypothetical protein